MLTSRRVAWVICIAVSMIGIDGDAMCGSDEPTGSAFSRAAEEKPSGPGKDATKPAPRVFDVMFKESADKHPFIPDTQYLDMFAAGAFMTSDRNIAEQRAIDAHRICKDLLVLLQRYSPRSDRFDERLKKKEIRQRTLLCAMASEADAKKGSFNEVGDFAVVKEQRPAHFDQGRASKVRGSDLDAVWIYILTEPLYRNGELPQDIGGKISRDVAGYLFANADYFVNTDEQHPVDKADKKAVKEAAQKFITGIWDHMQAMLKLEHGWDRIEGLLKNSYSFYQEAARAD